MICSTVKITAAGVSQIDGAAVVATIPREAIRRAKLAYDPKARHPFLQFLAGFGLLVSGLILIIAAFIMVEVGAVFVRIASYALRIPVVPIGLWIMVGAGLWLLIGVFRGRYNILIDTKQGIRKIFFGESADIKEILRFIGRANQELGYRIDMSIMETMYISNAPSDHQTNT